ncbi:MAG: PP2C family protein-serine/threonine phosphatase [Candidatus Competibacterales bacterium]
MSPKSAPKWSSAAQTHVGMVRSLNEDAYLDLPHVGLWAVADGMGGHEAGDVASRMLVDGLSQITRPGIEDGTAFAESVKEKLREVNRRLRQESARRYGNRTIGSTVVIFLAVGGQGIGLWVGDSRLYRLRSTRLEQLSRDHSHVQDLVDQKLLTPEQAQSHPLGNVITRAVGSEEDLEVDEIRFDLQPGDVLLLCSDGLNKMVSDREIAEVLGGARDRALVKPLIDLALERGASDNVTAAVITVHDSEDDLTLVAGIDEDEDDTTIIVDPTEED